MTRLSSSFARERELIIVDAEISGPRLWHAPDVVEILGGHSLQLARTAAVDVLCILFNLPLYCQIERWVSYGSH
jgi:hypothetical protein